MRLFFFILICSFFQFIAPAVAGKPSYTAFKCISREGVGKKGDLNWWFDYSYQGFKWIECRVVIDHIKISTVKINGGNCSIVDNQFLDRDYSLGEVVIINHSCMDPVMIELNSDGKTSTIYLE